MTIVNKNSSSHSGLLVTGTGDDIDIDVELIGGRTLRMSASGDELGAWPIDECHIEPDPDRNGTFRIVVDGDDAIFTPVDPVGFRSLIDRVSGGESNGERSEMRSDTLGAALESRGASGDEAASAAEDPVAFLFGSGSPPTPPPQPVEPDVDDHADVSDLDDPVLSVNDRGSEAEEIDPFETADFDWDELDEIEVTIEPVGAYSPPAMPSEQDKADEVTDNGDAADVETISPVSPTLAERLAEAERLEAEADAEAGAEWAHRGEGPANEPATVEMSSPELDATSPDLAPDDASADRSRFGASALDRLSEAINSMTATSGPEEEPYEIEPNNVADEVLSTQRSLRDHRVKDAKRSQRLKLAIIAGVGVGLIALIALLAPGAIEFIQNYEGDAEPPPTLPVTETTVVVTATTIAQETAVPESTTTTLFAGAEVSVFALSAPEFVERWDAAAGIVDAALQFESNPIVGPFEEQFTPFLSMAGEVLPEGTLGPFSLIVDPSGPSEYDRIGIQALGVAIAAVDPDRSPQGRAALLGELGLNVRDPQLGGIDGSVQSDDVQYTLVYDAETALLTLTVAPAG